MKLAIWTQDQENYGSAENPHWKMKGGDVYVYPNLTAKQANAIYKHQAAGTDPIPTLRGLIEYNLEQGKCQIIDVKVCDDDEQVCAEWEVPMELFYTNDAWYMSSCQTASEWTDHWSHELAEVFKSWKMEAEGSVSEFFQRYVFTDGRVETTGSGDDFSGYVTD